MKQTEPKKPSNEKRALSLKDVMDTINSVPWAEDYIGAYDRFKIRLEKIYKDVRRD